MQPKNSLQNILLFCFLSGLVLFGAWRLQNWLYPPRDRVAEVNAKMWSDLHTRVPGTTLAVAPVIPTLGGAAQLAADAAIAQYLAERNYKLPPAPKQELAKQEPKHEAKAQVPPPKPAAPRRANVPDKVVRIGSDAYKLEVVLTSLGAGVESVVLTQFQAADKMGRPEASSEVKTTSNL